MCARACERMSLWEQTLAVLHFVQDKILGMEKTCRRVSNSSFCLESISQVEDLECHFSKFPLQWSWGSKMPSSELQSLMRSIVTTGAGLLSSLIGALGRVGRWEDALAWFEVRGLGDRQKNLGWIWML